MSDSDMTDEELAQATAPELARILATTMSDDDVGTRDLWLAMVKRLRKAGPPKRTGHVGKPLIIIHGESGKVEHLLFTSLGDFSPRSLGIVFADLLRGIEESSPDLSAEVILGTMELELASPTRGREGRVVH